LIIGGEVFYDLIEDLIPAQEVQIVFQQLQPEIDETIRKCGDDFECRKQLVSLKGAAAVAFVADLGQLVLQHCGYPTAGKVVGAVGNIGAGAMTGYAVAQVPGAIIGGVAGYALWQFTEWEYHRDIAAEIASL
jgi:hypothetical protein